MIEKRNDSENEFSAKKLQKLQQPKSSTYAQSSVRLKIHNRIRKSPVTRLQINNPPNDRKKPSLKITRARKHCLHIASEMPRISYKPNCNNKKTFLNILNSEWMHVEAMHVGPFRAQYYFCTSNRVVKNTFFLEKTSFLKFFKIKVAI